MGYRKGDTMDMDEVRHQKEELEKEISRKINDFCSHHGLVVTEIRVERRTVLGCDGKGIASNYTASVVVEL